MFHRKVCLIAVLFTLAGSAFAAGEWETDYGKALEKAKAENKRVLLDFTGSDWCGPCIQFRKRVLSRPDFAAYAAKRYPLTNASDTIAEIANANPSGIRSTR